MPRQNTALGGKPWSHNHHAVIMGLPFRAAQYVLFWTIGERAAAACKIPASAPARFCLTRARYPNCSA